MRSEQAQNCAPQLISKFQILLPKIKKIKRGLGCNPGELAAFITDYGLGEWVLIFGIDKNFSVRHYVHTKYGGRSLFHALEPNVRMGGLKYILNLCRLVTCSCLGAHDYRTSHRPCTSPSGTVRCLIVANLAVHVAGFIDSVLKLPGERRKRDGLTK